MGVGGPGGGGRADRLWAVRCDLCARCQLCEHHVVVCVLCGGGGCGIVCPRVTL